MSKYIPCKKCGYEKTILAKASAFDFVPDQCPYRDSEFIEKERIDIEITVFIQYCEKCHSISKYWIDD